MKNSNIFVKDSVGEEKPLIIIDDSPESASSAAMGGGMDGVPAEGVDDGMKAAESPVIIIEQSKEEVVKPRHRWPWFALGAVLAAVVFALAFGSYKYLRSRLYIGVPVSVDCKQNILNLQRPLDKSVRPEVVMSSDSARDVKFNLYELRGLRAEVSFVEPSPEDRSVYLYSRCADYGVDGKVIGSLVAEGKEMQKDVSRLGYCAMADGNVVIGVARSEEVKDYVMERGGSFFRQFILVSNYTLPPHFYLHGKVERRAIGRLQTESRQGLYYIESVNPETMYDFADALSDYGFVDAIYITGGNTYSYYRSLDGQIHQIGCDRQFKRSKRRTNTPWVVFKE